MTEKKKGKKPRKSRLFRCVACENHIAHILRVDQKTGHRSYRTNCLSKGWQDRNPFRGYPCGRFLQKSSIKLEDFLETPPKNVRREIVVPVSEDTEAMKLTAKHIDKIEPMPGEEDLTTQPTS